MVAKATASVPRIDGRHEPALEPAASSAPTMVMPEIALEPDISGVCSWEGTLEISSNPRKIGQHEDEEQQRVHVMASIVRLREQVAVDRLA